MRRAVGGMVVALAHKSTPAAGADTPAAPAVEPTPIGLAHSFVHHVLVDEATVAHAAAARVALIIVNELKCPTTAAASVLDVAIVVSLC